MKNQFTRMAASLYINYLLLGMINVIIASNMDFLTVQLGTDKAAISYLISAIGIGKLITLSFSGKLSDKLGRKPLVLTATFLYIIFLVGIPLAPNYQIAFVFAIVAGMCNSFMDSGTYPALIEAYPKNAGSATVLVKAFVSIGAIILPLVVAFLMNHELFYGIAFFIPAVVYLVNGLVLLKATFPNHKGNESNSENKGEEVSFSIQPKFWREGITTILVGFTSTALFMVMQVWLPTFGQEVLGMTKDSAVKLLSYYSIGSLVSVILLAVLLNRVIKMMTVFVLYPSVAFISLLVLLYIHQPVATIIGAFFFGLSTAGIFQLAVTIMTQFFPKNKGTSTAFVSLASSSSFIIVPAITGVLIKYFSVSSVLIFDLGVALASILLSIFLAYRYNKIFSVPKNEK